MHADKFLLAVLMLIVAIYSFSASAAGNAWSRITEPAWGAPAAIGDYTAGCLAGAAVLPADGNGYQIMRLSRQRFFGHPMLTNFIKDLSQQVAETQKLSLLIGDLGQARGGPTPSGHRSHQTGLDVDIWFEQETLGKRLSREERERRSAMSMVNADGMTVNQRAWNGSHAEVLRLASEFPSVERIFVNAAIKKNLCQTQRSRAWLHKIRPWWGHEEHFHVRLHCPPGSPQCLKQQPIPPGDGCDAGLDWWFSAEARQPAKPGPRIEPVLPAACTALLHATPGVQKQVKN